MGLNGTQLLLKSLGVDPAEIMAGVESFKNLAVEVKARQERVELMLETIQEFQVSILQYIVSRVENQLQTIADRQEFICEVLARVDGKLDRICASLDSGSGVESQLHDAILHRIPIEGIEDRREIDGVGKPSRLTITET